MSEEKFKQLFVNIAEAAVYLSPSFHILEANPRFTDVFGYSFDEVKGKHIDCVIVPKHKNEEARMLNTKAPGGYVFHDTVRKGKDGSSIPVSLSGAPIIVKGKLTGYIALYKDISKLKRTEKQLKKMLGELEMMNEKLGVVSKLTRHDVRNKLSTVTMNTFLAKQKLPKDHEALEHLSEIESAVGQVVRIFDFARTYEMLGVEELVYMDVEKTFKEAVTLSLESHKVKVESNCQGLKVLADSLLRQLFYNLVDNSLKHGRKVSRIRLYCKEMGIARGNQLKLVYEDDGIGILKAEKEKIFKEGYGKGTGYGLYLIRKMCEVYDWTIQETGERGKGAQFTITVPRTNTTGKISYQLH